MDGYDKLVRILEDTLGIDKNEITEESSLIDDFGADSMDLYQIVVAMEQEFDMEFDPEESAAVKTVEDLMRLVRDEL